MLAAGCWAPEGAHAGQLPSLFRGVVVADLPATEEEGQAGSALGIRVVSVEESSQASKADLRPEDVIVQINDKRIRTIDEFAVVSQEMKGRAIKASLLVLRDGQPREVLLHLYSYPVLRQWDLAFIPEHDIRFADSKAGVEYWARLARGYEEAGDVEQALNAYLNALHNDPGQLGAALKALDLLWRIAQWRLNDARLSDALLAIEQASLLLRRLFDQPLSEAQLRLVKRQLEEMIKALRAQAITAVP